MRTLIEKFKTAKELSNGYVTTNEKEPFKMALSTNEVSEILNALELVEAIKRLKTNINF